MKRLIILSSLTMLCISCSPLRKLPDAQLSVAGSSWKYVDEDWTYGIQFSENEKLVSTHPNDNTPNNDFWEQSGDAIHFEFNDGFSQYDGSMKTLNFIVGEGKSTSGSWKWTLRRIK